MKLNRTERAARAFIRLMVDAAVCAEKGTDASIKRIVHGYVDSLDDAAFRSDDKCVAELRRTLKRKMLADAIAYRNQHGERAA